MDDERQNTADKDIATETDPVILPNHQSPMKLSKMFTMKHNFRKRDHKYSSRDFS